MIKKFFRNVLSMIMMLSLVIAGFSVLIAFAHVPDLFGDGLVMENYDGVDHFYNGQDAFFISIFLFLIFGIIFAIIYKFTKPIKS